MPAQVLRRERRARWFFRQMLGAAPCLRLSRERCVAGFSVGGPALAGLVRSFAGALGGLACSGAGRRSSRTQAALSGGGKCPWPPRFLAWVAGPGQPGSGSTEGGAVVAIDLPCPRPPIYARARWGSAKSDATLLWGAGTFSRGANKSRRGNAVPCRKRSAAEAVSEKVHTFVERGLLWVIKIIGHFPPNPAPPAPPLILLHVIARCSSAVGRLGAQLI